MDLGQQLYTSVCVCVRTYVLCVLLSPVGVLVVPRGGYSATCDSLAFQ